MTPGKINLISQSAMAREVWTLPLIHNQGSQIQPMTAHVESSSGSSSTTVSTILINSSLKLQSQWES